MLYTVWNHVGLVSLINGKSSVTQTVSDGWLAKKNKHVMMDMDEHNFIFETTHQTYVYCLYLFILCVCLTSLSM